MIYINVRLDNLMWEEFLSIECSLKELLAIINNRYNEWDRVEIFFDDGSNFTILKGGK